MSQHPRTAIRTPAGSGTATPTVAQGSQTLLQTVTDPGLPVATLRLRAAEPVADGEPALDQTRSRRIRWSESVVDNEGLGRKSSKVCCIYHAAHEPGDSESGSSSSSEDDSDSEADLSRAQPANNKKRQTRRKRGSGDKERRPSPNAYERQPKPKNPKAG